MEFGSQIQPDKATANLAKRNALARGSQLARSAQTQDVAHPFRGRLSPGGQFG